MGITRRRLTVTTLANFMPYNCKWSYGRDILWNDGDED